jgi:osmotically-inducible protein OsmY
MAYKSDEAIKNEVQFQLGWDSRIKQTEIGVTVQNGVVTLTGTVDSYAKKLAAKEAAHRARSVLDVANDIEVRTSHDSNLTDADIAQAVRHALEWDVLVPDQKIHSTVTGGYVTLEGNLEYITERTDTERAVSHLPGVRGVINQIKIAAPVDRGRIKFMIEDVLELRADREANRLKIGIAGGEVTITGTVNTWDEKRAILGAVGHAPGVTAIHDHIYIDPEGIEFAVAE